MGRGTGPAIDEVAALARLLRKEAFRGVAELSGVGRGRERSIDRALEMPTSGWPCSLLHYKRPRHIFDLLASEHSRALLPRTSLASSHHSTSKRRGLRRCCCCSLHSCRHQLKNTNQPTQFELFLIPHFSDPPHAKHCHRGHALARTNLQDHPSQPVVMALHLLARIGLHVA